MKFHRFAIAITFCLVLVEAQASPLQLQSGQQVAESAHSLLLAEKFDELEAQAARFRKMDDFVVGGNPAINSFYLGLTSGPDQFTSIEPKVHRWIEAKPGSSTAHVVLARILDNYAWEARGHQYASQTGAEQWKAFAAGVKAAAQELKLVSPDFQDPFAFSVEIGISRDAGADRTVLDELYRRQIGLFPTYWPAYSMRANLLQAKWLGGPGELSGYVKSLHVDPGAENGQIAYFEIARRNACCMDTHALFGKDEFGYSWPELKQAYAVTESRYGLTNFDWNVIAKLATLAEDRETTKLALSRMNGRRDPDVWMYAQYFLAVLYGKYDF